MLRSLMLQVKEYLRPPPPTNNYWQNRRLRAFLESEKCVVVNIGSKNRSLGDDIFYADIQEGADLDVVCDIHDLPFKDDRIGGIVLTAVLEHVHSSIRGVEECLRVLSPGGRICFDSFHAGVSCRSIRLSAVYPQGN